MSDKNVEKVSVLKNKLDGLSIQKYLVWAGFFVIFVLVFALNYFFPIYADDMTYSVVRFGESLNLLENLTEIKDFLIYYYFNWGGQVVAIGSVHLLLLLDPIIQDLLNTIFFLILLYAAYQISNGHNKSNFCLLIFISASIFYFTPSFISSAIWITGSGVFMLTATLSLIFIYPYHKYYDKINREKDSTLRTILFFICGIIAGWSNENTGPALVFIIVAYVGLIYWRQNKQVPQWAISGMIGVIIGCSFMIFAPGNAVRAAAEGFPSLFSSFDNIVSKKIFTVIGVYKVYLLKVTIPYFIFLLIFWLYPKNEAGKKAIIVKSLIFFLAANVSTSLIAFAPTFPPRALFIMVVLFILSAGILYANIDFKKLFPKVVNYIFLAFLLYGSTLLYVQYFNGAKFLHSYMIEREAAIADAKKQGKKEVAVLAIHLDDRFEYTDFKNFYRDYYDLEVLFLELGDPRLNIDNDKTN